MDLVVVKGKMDDTHFEPYQNDSYNHQYMGFQNPSNLRARKYTIRHPR